jgi:acyl-coenzyme A synthetase/AMP-(fatty) acid ligase
MPHAIGPSDAAVVPLVARKPADVLFRTQERSFTTSDFLRDAARTAAELPEAGHVFNLCRDRYLFAVTLAAASLRNQICVLTSDLAPERLRALADRFGSVTSVADDPVVTSPLRHHQIGHLGNSHQGNSHHGAEEAESPGRMPPAIPSLPADRVAAIVFTSGSTAEPIASTKLWGALAERSIAGGNRFAMDAQRPASVVGMVPPRHMYGFETTLLLPLHAACSSWCAPLFYPHDVCAALAAVPAPRTLVTTPLQLRALLQAELALPALERVISATAPLDRALAAEAERRWNTKLFEIFGATEVGSIASRRTVTDDIWTTYDGIALQGAPDGTARVVARCAPDGALNDLVEVLAPNRFRLLGRDNDLVKLAGHRASLAGLNRILVGIPGVADGVFVAPDDPARQPSARMQAFVIAPTRSAEDILAELRRQIDPIFLPRRVVRVDELPRNEVGKLPREALRTLRTHLGDDG